MTGTVTDIDIVRVMMNEFYLELPGLSNFGFRGGALDELQFRMENNFRTF